MAATLSCSKKLQVYRPRRPEKTVLFRVIKKHYKTWHKNAKNPIAPYIDNEFKKYLGCGILAKGFAYAHCEGCNKDFLIAFSCKGRGICPSCNPKGFELLFHLRVFYRSQVERGILSQRPEAQTLGDLKLKYPVE